MDTRSKKFKYTFFAKLLCLLLCVALFSGAVACAFRLLAGITVVGFQNAVTDKSISYFESNAFKSYFIMDFNRLYNISQNNFKAQKEAVNAERSKMIDVVLNDYLKVRGQIIKSELEYAVNNWDESYYNYEDTIDDSYDELLTETSVEYSTGVLATAFNTNNGEPVNITVAQKILESTNSIVDFNKYSDLVRDVAFGYDYIYDKAYTFKIKDEFKNLQLSVDLPSMTYGEEAAEKYISQEIDDCISQHFQSENYDNTLYYLERLRSVKYYVEDFDGNVTSNVDKVPENIESYKHCVVAYGTEYKVNGIEFDYINELLEGSSFNKLCIYFENDFEDNVISPKTISEILFKENSDDYTNSYAVFSQFKEHSVGEYVTAVVVMLILSVVFLILLVLRCGYKNGCEGIKLSFIDKVPTDVHFIVSLCLAVSLPLLLVNLNYGVPNDLLCTAEFKYFAICCGAVASLFITELVCSFARIKKSNQSIFKRTLIYKIAAFFAKVISKLINLLKKEMAYKPKYFKFQVIIGFVAYLFINLSIIVIGALFTGYVSTYFVFFAGFVLLGFNLLIACFVVKYVNELDRLIVASGEKNGDLHLPSDAHTSLKNLAENLSDKNEALNEAVEEAVKKEQMKTALITNVSHDLKTPLTSLINYSSLLNDCNISDEKAKEYIGVINNQSDKLKRLIEDLIEASKVSTGNVQLNKVRLNLYELAVQAVVEFTPDLEKNGNEIKLNEPEKTPVVCADSTKTYRIISNLLSNVKKYSAPNTRVYACVYEDASYGYFEIKNISKEPLNISTSELTERFVRGDESRSKEGNGLGLSIAKDLCKLQNGELILKIDGDLFKAIIKLPK